MGLLDQLLSGIIDDAPQKNKSGPPSENTQKNAEAPPQESQPLEAKGELLYDWISKLIVQQGGITGLLQHFQKKGLGGIIREWIGPGANPAISSAIISVALGKDVIRSVSSQIGLTEKQFTEGIAKLLPVMVDQLTPHGELPKNESPHETGIACNGLKSTFFGI